MDRGLLAEVRLRHVGHLAELLVVSFSWLLPFNHFLSWLRAFPGRASSAAPR